MQRDPVKSAARVLHIFELFAERRAPLPLKDIVAELGLPQSSATVLMKSLLAMGYVNYDRQARTYLPSLKLGQIAHWLSEQIYLQQPIVDLMAELSRKTGETVALAVQNDIHVQYLRVHTSEQLIRLHIPEGSMRPLTHSSLGWLLLSEKPDPMIEKIVRQINIIEAEPADRVEIDALFETLQAVRRLDHCFIPDRPLAGAATVSMLLPWDLHGRRLAIGVGGLLDRIEPALPSIVATMRETIAGYAARSTTP